jgi:hypothetical protein
VAVGEEDVLGLDVAMDHVVPARVVEGRRDLAGDPHRLRNPELLLALDSRAQRLALDERRCVIQHAVRPPRMQQRQDVRVRQPREELDLLDEAIAVDGLGALRPQDLQRDPAPQPVLGGQVDDGLATAAELALDRVAIDSRGIGHRWPRSGSGPFAVRNGIIAHDHASDAEREVRGWMQLVTDRLGVNGEGTALSPRGPDRRPPSYPPGRQLAVTRSRWRRSALRHAARAN